MENMKFKAHLKLDGEEEQIIIRNTQKEFFNAIFSTLDIRNDQLKGIGKSGTYILTQIDYPTHPGLIVLADYFCDVPTFILNNLNFKWEIKEVIIDGQIGSLRRKNVDINMFLNFKM